MAKLYFTNTGDNSWSGMSESDANVTTEFSSAYTVDITTDILNEIRQGKKVPKSFDGTTVTYEDKSIVSVSAEVATQIADETYLAPEGSNDILPWSKNGFEGQIQTSISNIQSSLAQHPNHPLKTAAENYVAYLQGINLDSITWPLSKFVGEYASENSATVVHAEEII